MQDRDDANVLRRTTDRMGRLHRRGASRLCSSSSRSFASENRLSTLLLIVIGMGQSLLLSRIPPPAEEIETSSKTGRKRSAARAIRRSPLAIRLTRRTRWTSSRTVRRSSFVELGILAGVGLGRFLVVRPRLGWRVGEPRSTRSRCRNARAPRRRARPKPEATCSQTVVRCYRDMLELYRQSRYARQGTHSLTPRELTATARRGGRPRTRPRMGSPSCSSGRATARSRLLPTKKRWRSATCASFQRRSRSTVIDLLRSLPQGVYWYPVVAALVIAAARALLVLAPRAERRLSRRPRAQFAPRLRHAHPARRQRLVRRARARTALHRHAAPGVGLPRILGRRVSSVHEARGTSRPDSRSREHLGEPNDLTDPTDTRLSQRRPSGSALPARCELVLRELEHQTEEGRQ